MSGVTTLVLCWILAAPQSDSARAVVRAIQHAAETGQLASAQRQWQSRLARNRTDRLAQLAIASAEQLSYRFEAAESRLVAVRRSLSPREDEISRQAALQSGNILVAQGRYEAGRQALARVGSDAMVAHDTLTAIEANLARTGITSRLLGAPAATALLDSVTVLRPERDSRLEMTYRCRRGQILTLLNKYPDARREAHAGVRLARRVGMLRGEGSCLFVLLTVFARTGQTDSVRALADTLLAVQRRAGDHYGLSATQQWLGYYQIDLGHFQQAREMLDEALAAAHRARNTEMLAWTTVTQIRLAIVFRDVLGARRLVRRGDSLMLALGDRWGRLQVVRQSIDVAAVSGDLEIARRLADSAAMLAEELRDPTWQFGVAGQAKEIAARSGDLDVADRFQRVQQQLADRHGLRGYQPQLQREYAELALRRGRWAEADSLLGAIIGAWDPAQHAGRYGIRVARALAKLRRGDVAAAEREAFESAREFDRWRATLSDSAYRLYATQSRVAFGSNFGIASLVAELARRNRVEVAFELVERQRARELRDRLALASAWTGATAADARRRPTPADSATAFETVRSRLPDDSTALLLFATGTAGEPSTAILVSRSFARAVALEPADSLAPLVARFVASLEAGREPRVLQGTLGTLLLGDVLRDLPSHVTRLVIVPDGVLHRVPFDALLMPNGKFVVQRFETSIVPSASIAATFWGSRSTARSSGLLAYGDPAFGNPSTVLPRVQASARGGGKVAPLPRLPGSADEVRRLRRYDRDATLRLRGDASEAHLKRAGGDSFGVLHLATHALVDDWSVAGTAIALAPGDGEDGWLTPGEISTLQLDVDLVVLSACRSAGGEVLGGEGVRGLATPFLEAGARAILATGWRVSDRRIVDLVDAFYAGVADGRAIGTALRQAKLRLLARGAPVGEWSVFNIVGDASLIIPLKAVASR